jgi:mono/diheme cytochrome c family protein
VLFLLLPVLVLFANGCMDMYDQPSFKPQEGPRLSAPDGAVPVRGIDAAAPGEKPVNTVAKTALSIERGKKLYGINCALCHGYEGRGDGLVGKKLVPPPPNLLGQRVQRLDDSDIFLRITNGFGRMPAFGRRISREGRWDLVNYVKEFNEE